MEILTLFIGVAIALSCVGVSLWLAKAMWTSRMTTLLEENEALRRRLTEASSLQSILDGLSRLESRQENTTEIVDKLDQNVFKLVQLQTGEVLLTNRSGSTAPWEQGIRENRHTSEPPSVLPGGLVEPT